MVSIGTPLSSSATRVLILGSGELGKELAIEFQRLGCEVIACDRYADAPAMQVAHRAYVFSMLDGKRLKEVIEQEQPHLIVPEIEAIATDTLMEMEKQGFNVVPCARAVQLTMNREGIRRLASEVLGLPTSPYLFVNNEEELADAAQALGYPCVIKPLMSSSGKGQSVIRDENALADAWKNAQQCSRGHAGRCIVEGYVNFNYEITVLTVAAVNGIQCCPPIGHLQIDGDYRESWQPMQMSKTVWLQAEEIAQQIVTELGGFGLFGVELFVCNEEDSETVIFSEVSPRPHDTGLVTLGSQQLSQFALHARAALKLPIPEVSVLRPAASVALLSDGEGVPHFNNLKQALSVPESQLRLFGKPNCSGRRRLGVAIATADNTELARQRCKQIAATLQTEFDSPTKAQEHTSVTQPA